MDRAGPWDRFDDYVIDFALDRIGAFQRIALVTLVKIEGSSPRPLGAQMAVSEQGDWAGYLSGGCIERAVVAEALVAIEEGRNRRVRYGRGSKYIDIHLPCGSAIELVFDVSVSQSELQAVASSVKNREVAALRVPEMLDGQTDAFVTRWYYPRRRLIVAGVGPAAVHLARLGQFSAFETVLYSPDSATRESAEACGLSSVLIAGIDTIPDFAADEWSAIVFMFHDHDWERKLIPASLDTPAFYIGAMGSRRTHRQRLEQLEKAGIDPVRLGRIHGPAGLFSGAKSAPDVAMSILAEIMQIERSKNLSNAEFKTRACGLASAAHRQSDARFCTAGSFG